VQPPLSTPPCASTRQRPVPSPCHLSRPPPLLFRAAATSIDTHCAFLPTKGLLPAPAASLTLLLLFLSCICLYRPPPHVSTHQGCVPTHSLLPRLSRPPLCIYSNQRTVTTPSHLSHPPAARFELRPPLETLITRFSPPKACSTPSSCPTTRFEPPPSLSRPRHAFLPVKDLFPPPAASHDLPPLVLNRHGHSSLSRPPTTRFKPPPPLSPPTTRFSLPKACTRSRRPRYLRLLRSSQHRLSRHPPHVSALFPASAASLDLHPSFIPQRAHSQSSSDCFRLPTTVHDKIYPDTDCIQHPVNINTLPVST
jgi:hypothetical protein